MKRRPLAVVAIAAALALAGGLATCGGGASSPDAGAPGSASGSAHDKVGIGINPSGGFFPGGTSGGGGTGLSAVVGDSPLAGSGTAGDHLRVSLSVNSPITGTGSSGSPLGTSISVSSPVTGTGSSGSPLTTSISVSSPIAGTGSSGNPLTTSLSVSSPVTGTGSAGNPLTTSLNVGAGLGGTGSAGNALVTNLTTTTCTNGQGVASIAASGAGTCGTVAPNEYGQTHYTWKDDWMFDVCGTTAFTTGTCGTIWTTFESGAATQVTSTGATTRPGIMQLTMGTTTTGRATLASGLTVDFGSGNWQFEWVGGFPTLSDVGTPTDSYASFVGFGDVDTTVNQTNGCGFYYDSQNVITSGANSGKVQNLECYCAKAGTRTAYLLAGAGNSDESFALGTVAVGALSLPSTNILHLLVKMTGTTRAEFYTVSGTTQTKVCDINTNVPASATLMRAMMKNVKNAGTNARLMDVDFTNVVFDMTSARTP